MKRSHDDLTNAAQRKKQKTRAARTIAVESQSSSLKNGNIPLQDFLSSRRFEINALMASMQKSREAGVQRAFQSLPRYLRRRAASHNVKRVPRRLRARAEAEITDQDKAVKHLRAPFKRKRGRRNTIKKLARLKQLQERKEAFEPDLLPGTNLPSVKAVLEGRYAKRQKSKTWLPSHLWTCKRAKMQTKWGYAIPISPNEKTYRSTHRASMSLGSICFDTSYFGTIILSGSAEELSGMIESMTKSRNACGARAQKGQRAHEVTLYDGDELICPATILWNAGPEKAVQLRVHPASYIHVWRQCQKLRADSKYTFKMVDARFELGSIEIIGPAAINTVLSVLKPAEGSVIMAAFQSTHGCMVHDLPPNVVIPLTALDPRKSFPPILITEARKDKNPFLGNWPYNASNSALFNIDAVKTSNRARAEQNPFPCLLQSNNLGLTIIAPWSRIGDLFYSLNHLPKTRFGGLVEYAQIQYSHSMPTFPVDFPGTQAGRIELEMVRKGNESTWLRKPPAKRTSFKNETTDPFGFEIASTSPIEEPGSWTPKDSIPESITWRLVNEWGSASDELRIVKIRLISRGCPLSRARIYERLDDGGKGEMIGFITTGNYNLAEGRSTAIGSIRRPRTLDCWVRNIGTTMYREAKVEYLALP